MHNSRFFSIRLIATFLTWALLAPHAARAQTVPKPTLAEAIGAIEAYAPQAMAEQGAPGLSIAITDRTHTLRIITLGYANLDTREPVTDTTRFAIGSITKSMTAASLLELYDRKRLDLNATVRRYLPWFSIDAGGKPILVHQVLSHTAGLPGDYTATAGYVFGIAALRDAHVLFAPGTAWAYSNDGYATAGAILAQIDGRPWADSVRARIFAPLGMTHSSTVFTPQSMAASATGYEFRDFDRPAAQVPPLVASRLMDFVNPAGSVLSTPDDMAKYMRLILNGGKTAGGTRVLSDEAYVLWTTPDSLANGKPAGTPGVEMAEWPAFYKQYAFGLSVFADRGDKLVGHTGGISGYTACMQTNLTRGFGVIAMSNLVEAPLHPCAIVKYAMEVLRAQSAGEQLPTLPAAKDTTSIAHASDYVGSFWAADGHALAFAASGKHLTLQDGTMTYKVYPRGGDYFWTDDPHYPLFLFAFGRDTSKHVVELTYGSLWFASTAYTGPRTFTHPQKWDALAGRYETDFWGSPTETRVTIVKGELTLEGLTPLIERKDGTYDAGGQAVRFDTLAAGKMQRLWIDGIALYRVELP
jgi:CubicO group peptidase (beta-lactamase class C family)